ncbi:restriction endonuclease subunit S [Lachnospiraceae bacterium 47-T17]
MVLAEDLRQAVLQAALQGNLTEQLETDSDVDEMLINIQKEKKLLFNKKNAREEKIILIEEDEEKPYDIPLNWRWEKLGNIGIYKKGPFGSALTKSMFVPKSENTVKVYEQKNAIQKDASLGEYYITKEYFDSKMKGFVVETGDIIVSCAGTIGETYIMPDNIEFGIINQALMRMNIVQSLNITYFLIYFDNVLKMEAQKGSKGSAIKNIPPFEVFKKMLIPIPPFEEQQRIVDKINEIMPKIDEYEKIEKELETLKKQFPTNMKDALLQAAMQGKLTEQLESDSSVDELARKENIDLLDEEDYPYFIPDNWKFAELGELTSIPIKRGKAPKYVDKSGILVFAQKCNQKVGRISLDDAKYLDENIKHKYEQENYLQGNDIVINSTGGGTLGRIGYISEALFKQSLPIVPDSHITTIRTKDNISSKYIYFFLKFNQPYLETMGVGSTNQTELRPDTIKELLVPIPSIEEQQRIVERLEALLPLCEELKG